MDSSSFPSVTRHDSKHGFDKLDEESTSKQSGQSHSPTNLDGDEIPLDFASVVPLAESHDLGSGHRPSMDMQFPTVDPEGEVFLAPDNEVLIPPLYAKTSITNDFCWSVLLALIFCVFFSVLMKKLSRR
jgi:hypothetical protein